MQGNRRTAAVAVGEIVLGQHLSHRGGSQKSNHLGQVQTSEPFTVAAHLQSTGGLEIQQSCLPRLTLTQLGEVSGRIGINIVSRELNPRSAFTGWITDSGGEITNDQHRRVSGILKGPQLAEENAVAEMNVAAGRIDSELDAKGSGLPLGLQQPGRERLFRIPGISSGEKIGNAAREPSRQ